MTSSSGDIVFHEITSAVDPKLPDFLRLYEQIFPPQLKQDHAAFYRLMALKDEPSFRRDNVFHLSLLSCDARPVGLTSFNYLPDIRSGYIGYVGVVEDQRGNGWGRLLLELCRRQIIEDANRITGIRPDGIFAETERPDQAKNEIEHRSRESRILYYLHSGFRVFNEILFLQPAMMAGQSDIPLTLIFMPIAQSAPVFSKDRWAEIIRSLYHNIYKLENQLSDEATEGYIAKVLSGL